MRPLNILVLALVILLTAGTQLLVPAQAGSSSIDWETFRPEGEEFTILMPKGSRSEAAEQQYHKMILKTRLYISGAKAGPIFAIASFSGIKSNPAAYSDFQRMNSYVDAFKDWFPEKVRTKETPIKLTLVGDKSLNGHAGREYKVSIADLNGVAQVFATRKRFYAVVILSTKKDDDLQKQFLSSFALPDKVEPATTAAASAEPALDPNAAAQPKPAVNTDGLRTDKNERAERVDPNANANDTNPNPSANDQANPNPTTEEKNAAEKKQRGPVNGGVLNTKALYLPKPDYPPEARSAKVAGTVVIQVLVDEQGGVTSAKAVSGHPLLQQVCLNAALQARFSPTTLMGEPVKVTGVLTFNFGQ
jgi:TonB family protein